jgi:hypothetical protein
MPVHVAQVAHDGNVLARSRSRKAQTEQSEHAFSQQVVLLRTSSWRTRGAAHYPRRLHGLILSELLPGQINLPSTWESIPVVVSLAGLVVAEHLCHQELPAEDVV